MPRILGISGSLRRDSHNTSPLRAAAKLLPPGVERAVYSGLRELSPYDKDADLQPGDPAVAGIRTAIAAPDGVLIATRGTTARSRAC